MLIGLLVLGVVCGCTHAQYYSQQVAVEGEQWAAVAYDGHLWYTPIDYVASATVKYATYSVYVQPDAFSPCTASVAKVLCAQNVSCVAYALQSSPVSCTFYYSVNGLTPTTIGEQTYYTRCVDNCVHTIDFRFEHINDEEDRAYSITANVQGGQITAVRHMHSAPVIVKSTSFVLPVSGMPDTVSITCASGGVLLLSPPLAHVAYNAPTYDTNHYTQKGFIMLVIVIVLYVVFFAVATHKHKND